MKRVVARIVPAVVLLVAACGGGEETLTKEEYLKQADVICDEGNKELEEASKDAFSDVKEGESPTKEQIEDYARKTVLPMVRGQVGELRDLPPPEGGKAEVEEIYDAIESALDKVEKDPSLLGSGNLFAEADALSKKYGYEVCTGG